MIEKSNLMTAILNAVDWTSPSPSNQRKKPPPSHEIAQQYINHYPSLPDSAPVTNTLPLHSNEFFESSPVMSKKTTDSTRENYLDNSYMCKSMKPNKAYRSSSSLAVGPKSSESFMNLLSTYEDCQNPFLKEQTTQQQTFKHTKQVSKNQSDQQDSTSLTHSLKTVKHSSDERVNNNQILRIRAIISGWKAGMIIGRHGAVINSLRQASNCKIVMSADATNPDRVLSITGTYSNVVALLSKICYLLSLSPHYDYTIHNHEACPISEYSFAPDSSETYTLHFILAVPSYLCGYLIGRKGSKIREFREKYKVLFSVSPTTIQNSYDRPVTISGYFENVANCLKEVCKYLTQQEDLPVSKHSEKNVMASEDNQSFCKNEPINTNKRVDSAPHHDSNSDKSDLKVTNPSEKPSSLLKNSNIPQLSKNSSTIKSKTNVRTNASIQIASKSKQCSNISQQPPKLQAARYTIKVKQVMKHYNKSQINDQNEHSLNNQTKDENANLNFPSNTASDAVETKSTYKSVDNKQPKEFDQADMDQNPLRIKFNKSKQQFNNPNAAINNDTFFSNFIRECSFFLDNGDTEVHLLVPNDIVGCIIGRGGRTISEIRDSSGAYISITDSTFPPEQPSNAVSRTSSAVTPQRNSGTQGNRRDRVIVIRGNEKSVQVARYLMGSSILSAQRYCAFIANNKVLTDF